MECHLHNARPQSGDTHKDCQAAIEKMEALPYYRSGKKWVDGDFKELLAELEPLDEIFGGFDSDDDGKSLIGKASKKEEHLEEELFEI